MESRMQLMDMPLEIIEKILESLTLLKDVKNASETCRLLFKASQSPNLLKRTKLVVKREEQLLYLNENCHRQFINVSIDGHAIRMTDMRLFVKATLYFYDKYSSNITSVTFLNIKCFALVKLAMECFINLTSIQIINCIFHLYENDSIIICCQSRKTKIIYLKIENSVVEAPLMEYIFDSTPNLMEVIFNDRLDHHPLINYLTQNSDKIKCLSFTAHSMNAVRDVLQIPLNLQYFHLAVLKKCFYDDPILELQRFCLPQKKLVYLNVDYNTQPFPVKLLELENVILLHAFDDNCSLTSPDRFKCFWKDLKPITSVSKCFFNYLEQASQIKELRMMMIDRVLEERHLFKFQNLTSLTFVCIISEELLQGIWRYLVKLHYLFLSDDLSKHQIEDSALTGYCRTHNRKGFVSISRLQNLRKIHINKQYYNHLSEDTLMHLAVNFPYLTQVAIYGSKLFSLRTSELMLDYQFTVTYGKRSVFDNETKRNGCDFFSLP